MINKLLIKYYILYHTVLLFAVNIHCMQRDIAQNLNRDNTQITTANNNNNLADIIYEYYSKRPNNNANDKTLDKQPDRNLYRCDFEGCNYYTIHVELLERHRLIHSNNKLYRCKVKDCNYSTINIGRFQKHIEKHNNKHNNNGLYRCKVADCSYTGKRLRDLTKHVTLSHTFKSNTQLVKLNMDLQNHNGAIDNLQTVTTVQSYNKIPSQDKQCHGTLYKCNFEGCNYISEQLRQLNLHMTIHIKGRLYKCTKCDYNGESRTVLIRHMKTHAKRRLYKCELCCYITKQAARFKKHKCNTVQRDIDDIDSASSNVDQTKIISSVSPSDTGSLDIPNSPIQLAENIYKEDVCMDLDNTIMPYNKIIVCRCYECGFHTTCKEDFDLHMIIKHDINNKKIG